MHKSSEAHIWVSARNLEALRRTGVLSAGWRAQLAHWLYTLPYPPFSCQGGSCTLCLPFTPQDLSLLPQHSSRIQLHFPRCSVAQVHNRPFTSFSNNKKLPRAVIAAALEAGVCHFQVCC